VGFHFNRVVLVDLLTLCIPEPCSILVVLVAEQGRDTEHQAVAATAVAAETVENLAVAAAVHITQEQVKQIFPDQIQLRAM
jgi:hypothetical protein